MAGRAVVSYAYDLRHWRTIDEFREHLAKHDPLLAAPWAKGVVLHHTYRPLPSQWNGAITMNAMSSRYEAMGWRGGPHLFLVIGGRKSEFDGIWQMCPLNVPGVHCSSVPGNNTMWGIEVVGDYDERPWPDDVHRLVRSTTLALMDWRKIKVQGDTLKGHREYPAAKKTCPGKAINLDAIRYEFATYQLGAV
jgi:hypothetical protein